jgi:hypothetical protein
MRHPERVFLIGIVMIGLGAWVLWTNWYEPGSIEMPIVQADEVNFTVLAQGDNSDVALRRNYHIKSEYELRELWKLVREQQESPKIDFEKESVLAIFAGTRPAAGYSIQVTKVADTDKRMVSIEVTMPGVSCLAEKTETAPYQIVTVPKSDLPLTHEETSRIEGCLQ